MKKYLTIMIATLFSSAVNAENFINNTIYPLTGGKCNSRMPFEMSLNSLPYNSYYEVTCTITKPTTYNKMIEMMASGYPGMKPPIVYTLNGKKLPSGVIDLIQTENILVAKGIWVGQSLPNLYIFGIVSDDSPSVTVSNCYANQIQK